MDCVTLSDERKGGKNEELKIRQCRLAQSVCAVHVHVTSGNENSCYRCKLQRQRISYPIWWESQTCNPFSRILLIFPCMHWHSLWNLFIRSFGSFIECLIACTNCKRELQNQWLLKFTWIRSSLSMHSAIATVKINPIVMGGRVCRYSDCIFDVKPECTHTIVNRIKSLLSPIGNSILSSIHFIFNFFPGSRCDFTSGPQPTHMQYDLFISFTSRCKQWDRDECVRVLGSVHTCVVRVRSQA